MCHIIKTKRIELEGGDSGPGKERKINNMWLQYTENKNEIFIRIQGYDE